MKKQAKRKKTAPTDEIPEDLSNMLGSLKALATTHHLLRVGTFTHEYSGALALTIPYIEALHKQVMSDAKAHPMAHMVPQFNTKPEAEQKALDTEFTTILDEAVKNGMKSEDEPTPVMPQVVQ